MHDIPQNWVPQLHVDDSRMCILYHRRKKMKTCISCRESFEESLFHKHGKSKKGVIRYHPHCKKCMAVIKKRDYEKMMVKNPNANKNKLAKQYSKSRKEFQELKSKLGCSICREKDPRCLEFHHLDPNTKLHSVSIYLYRANKKIAKEEMKKCIVLCSNCHKKEHYALYVDLETKDGVIPHCEYFAPFTFVGAGI